jgi:hypothetical protein
VPGREPARVGRPDYALARGEILGDAAAPVRVVAERDDVGAGLEQLVRELAGDSRAVRDVLAVDDAEVGTELLAQTWEPLLDCAATRNSEDVGEKEKLQLRTSRDAGRISTET